jgi:2-polyprenyl-6-methoxyphenol hydroxylase-like FAD-dependent oxidoreductase
VRIVDKTAEPGKTSRALAVHARTLELYRQLDLADFVVEHGHKVPAVNLWVKGEPAARLPFATVGEDLTAYAFLEIFPQDQHERLLIERLEKLGVAVERRTELMRFADKGDRVIANLRGPDGHEEECEATYIAGCDGARSLVRETLGTGFAGGTYRHVFYVADVEAAGPSIDGELHVDFDEADLLAVFPLAGEGRARLIGTVRDERADHADTLKFGDVSSQAIDHLKVQVKKVNWFSTYHVHHRVTEHFRKDRAFLLGDAAHIHSPVGGQGMNTGIGDAVNLAWKLAAVLAGRAPDSLLDSYETEPSALPSGWWRRLIARSAFATVEGRVAEIIRTRIVPVIFPKIVAFEPVRDYIFRTVSQITLNYRGMLLSVGSAGHVRGGDRLPWVPSEGADNFASLSAMIWQVHVYGTARPELAKWCADRNVKLQVFAWTAQHKAAGLARDALYLVRPDTYVALADASGAPDAIDRYCAERGLRLAPDRTTEPSAQRAHA